MKGISIKAILIAFVVYVVCTSGIFAVFMGFWVRAHMTPGADAESLGILAEQSSDLILVTSVLGIIFTPLSGFIAASMGKQAPRKNATVLGIVFIVWSLTAFFLHPHEPLWYRLVGVLGAFPLTYLGALLYRGDAGSQPAAQSQA